MWSIALNWIYAKNVSKWTKQKWLSLYILCIRLYTGWYSTKGPRDISGPWGSVFWASAPDVKRSLRGSWSRCFFFYVMPLLTRNLYRPHPSGKQNVWHPALCVPFRSCSYRNDLSVCRSVRQKVFNCATCPAVSRYFLQINFVLIWNYRNEIK